MTQSPTGSRTRKRFMLCWVCLITLFVSTVSLSAAGPPSSSKTMNRKLFLQRFVGLTLVCWVAQTTTALAAFQPAKPSPSFSTLTTINGNVAKSTFVAYKQMSLPLPSDTGDFSGITVPVACWFPVDKATTTVAAAPAAQYQHRISVRRIGQLLAGWDFIPEFVSKGYKLSPSSVTATIVNGRDVVFPETGPVVLLAHGYLGSRFDLSHLAEELAGAGFICVAAEYPESLAASYDRVPGLDRQSINTALLERMVQDWKLQPSAYGIVGHSLGCGTVLQTGDESWARVSIAGFPRNRDGTPVPGNGLLLASMNDGAVSLARMGGMASIADCNYEMLREEDAVVLDRQLLPRRSALVFDRPDGPNHISFLSEKVNDAMIEFLSPLLPVAQAFKIPVLDFDRYQLSRDSVATAAVVHPLIIRYLKQEMMSLR
jgi:hypothetical protein